MFDSVIFAGGGSRCFWQLGFWAGANQAGLGLSRSVSYAASTSAGCAIMTAALLGREQEALSLFRSLAADNPSNIHWQNLFTSTDRPLLPHAGMYRSVMREFLSPEDLDVLKTTTVEYLIARCPPGLPGVLGPLVGFTIYGLEKRITGRVHPRWSRQMGFEPLVASAHHANSVEDLIDIIMAASCVPPVLPSPPFRGHNVLDGGMIDNVPAFLSNDRPGSTLILLSKRYRKPLPQVANRIYAQPSEPIRIDKFDYANPAGLQQAFDLGLADGERLASTWTL